MTDAWQEYIKLKARSDVKDLAVSERMQHLEKSLHTKEKEFAELCECAEEMIEEIREFRVAINQQRRDNATVSLQLRDKVTHAKQLSSHVSELQSELRDSYRTIALQQELLQKVEGARGDLSLFERQCHLVSQERDEAYRAVIHLTSLISSQTTYIERVMASLFAESTRSAWQNQTKISKRRSFQSTASLSPQHSPILSHFPLLKPAHEFGGDSRRHTIDFSRSAASPSPPLSAGGHILTLTDSGETEPSIQEKVGAVAATVRKINEQCLAAIQDLAKKEIDISNRSTLPSMPTSNGKNSETNSPKADSSGKEAAFSGPSAISRLISVRVGDSETGSVASSQLSRGTGLTMLSTTASSLTDSDSISTPQFRRGTDVIELERDKNRWQPTGVHIIADEE
jgi:hypothetical protein